MDPRIIDIASRAKGHLFGIYGEGIRKVLIYGSHARGEESPGSDLDLLVIVDRSLSTSEVRAQLSDLILDVLIDEGELLSVIVIHDAVYEGFDSPFLQNVRRDGVET